MIVQQSVLDVVVDEFEVFFRLSISLAEGESVNGEGQLELRAVE